MSASSGVIRVCRLDRAVAFAVVGRATMSNCPTLRRAAEEAIAHGVEAVLLDLSRCDHLDSTFVGTLVWLHNAASKHGGTRFAVVCPSDGCVEVMRQMRIDLIVPVEQRDLPDGDHWSDLAADYDTEEFQRDVLEAHEELARLPDDAGAPFRRVAQRMREEWDSSHGGVNEPRP